MKVLQRTGLTYFKGVALIAALGWLSLSLVTAAPARGMEQSGRAQQPLLGASALVTGAPAALGVEDGGVLSTDAAARTLAVTGGANWVRVFAYWYLIEAVQGTYDFSSSDAALNPLLNDGLSPIVILVDNPSWAANTNCGPVDTNNPARVAAVANVMGALAARYPGVKIWSLYNEIDSTGNAGGGCFGSFNNGGINNNGVPDYQEYAIELAAVSAAVHSANPNAQVAMGALAMDSFDPQACPPNYPGGCVGGGFNYNFAPNLFGYMKNHPLPGDAPYMDMALMNYYDVYGHYWESVAGGYGTQAKANAFHKRITDAGLADVPLGVTETGVRSNLVGLDGQARCVDMIMVRGMAARLALINWWSFKDYSDSEPYPKNTWKYGLVDQNVQPKNSYTAFKTLTTELNGYTFKKAKSGKRGFADVEVYFFKNGAKKKYVVWSSSVTLSDYSVPGCAWSRNSRKATFKAAKLRVVDYKGKAITIKDNSKRDKDKTVGKIAIMVANDPKVVQINP